MGGWVRGESASRPSCSGASSCEACIWRHSYGRPWVGLAMCGHRSDHPCAGIEEGPAAPTFPYVVGHEEVRPTLGHMRPSMQPFVCGHEEGHVAYAGDLEQPQRRARPRVAIEQIYFTGYQYWSRAVGYGGLDAPVAVLLCAAHLGTS